MTVLAVALAGLSAALLAGGRPDLLRSRLIGGRGPGSLVGDPAEDRRNRPGGARLPAGEVMLGRIRALPALAAAVGAAALAGPVVGVVVAGALALLFGLRARRSAARRRQRRESDVVDACLALSADLRAGVPPRKALEAASVEWPDLLGHAAGGAAVGADIVAALREGAQRPGAAALDAVAAGWDVSERTGAALSQVLVAVADSLRSEAAARREADAQLAIVRATSRLLAILPVSTLLLLSGGGGAPVEFLTGSSYGLACLCAAGALVGAGLWWIDRLARSAVASSWDHGPAAGAP